MPPPRAHTETAAVATAEEDSMGDALSRGDWDDSAVRVQPPRATRRFDVIERMCNGEYREDDGDEP